MDARLAQELKPIPKPKPKSEKRSYLSPERKIPDPEEVRAEMHKKITEDLNHVYKIDQARFHKINPEDIFELVRQDLKVNLKDLLVDKKKVLFKNNDSLQLIDSKIVYEIPPLVEDEEPFRAELRLPEFIMLVRDEDNQGGFHISTGEEGYNVSDVVELVTGSGSETTYL